MSLEKNNLRMHQICELKSEGCYIVASHRRDVEQMNIYVHCTISYPLSTFYAYKIIIIALVNLCVWHRCLYLK